MSNNRKGEHFPHASSRGISQRRKNSKEQLGYTQQLHMSATQQNFFHPPVSQPHLQVTQHGSCANILSVSS